MRIQSLLRLFAFAALLPVAAHAEWPEGSRDTYMQECLATATQNVDKDQAEKHCECGAEVIGKNFTKEEIATLNDRNNAPPAALRERLLQSVAVCKTQ